MKKIAFILALLVTSQVYAGDLICPKKNGEGEGSWPIPESAFTKEAADEAIQKLKLYVSKGTSEMDSNVIDNKFLMLKGYLLKDRVSAGVPYAKEDFCRFMKNNAYVQH